MEKEIKRNDQFDLNYDTNLGGYRTGITESSCEVRQNTAATTIGIKPELEAWTTTTVSFRPELAS